MKKSKLEWKKYLTREYSFLYISYAADCYRMMKREVGATIEFDLAHGKKNLVSLYGIDADFEKCYQDINRRLERNPKRGIGMMNKFDILEKEYYELVYKAEKAKDKIELKNILIGLDKTFLRLLCYYLHFVYLGYGGDKPAINKFLRNNKKRFEKIRNSGVDAHMDKNFPKIFGKLSKEHQMLIQFMARKELVRFLGGKELDFDKIRQRKKEYLLITKNGKTRECGFNIIKNVLGRELPGSGGFDGANELKGRVANKGLAKGKAVVVYSSKDYRKIKKGAILVTPMTKPDVVPFLFKVSAIITDDGGALSHASIISRELNIPCIVGTKIATQVLKDGDMVEVDADRGVVRILK
jgi:phosphoenolpyruvate synthase/pyruvate phosphate dikinase